MSQSIAIAAVIVGFGCLSASYYYDYKKHDIRKGEIAAAGWPVCMVVYFALLSTPMWLKIIGIAGFGTGALLNVLKLRKVR